MEASSDTKSPFSDSYVGLHTIGIWPVVGNVCVLQYRMRCDDRNLRYLESPWVGRVQNRCLVRVVDLFSFCFGEFWRPCLLCLWTTLFSVSRLINLAFPQHPPSVTLYFESNCRVLFDLKLMYKYWVVPYDGLKKVPANKCRLCIWSFFF